MKNDPKVSSQTMYQVEQPKKRKKNRGKIILNKKTSHSTTGEAEISQLPSEATEWLDEIRPRLPDWLMVIN